MLDGAPIQLTKMGTVTIDPARRCRVIVEGFEAPGGSCRDVAVLAVAWAIGELQRELLGTLEKPGGGRIGVG